MPELPEVECIRRSLEAHLLGARVRAVRVRTRSYCHLPKAGTPTDDAHALLQGATIASLHRLGKQLAIVSADGRCLALHLGMSGQLIVGQSKACNTPRADDPNEHVTWDLKRAGEEFTMSFRDPRRFGGVWCFDSFDEMRHARWRGLGPDALTISGHELWTHAGRSARSIKAVLLDQRVLAGVGNIYADESLFLSGVAPKSRACLLSTDEWIHLATCVQFTLKRAIARGGSTLRDYVNTDGSKGEAQHTHQVYGRAGKPCTRCALALRGEVIAGRATVWCPRCQPAQRARRTKPWGS